MTYTPGDKIGPELRYECTPPPGVGLPKLEVYAYSAISARVRLSRKLRALGYGDHYAAANYLIEPTLRYSV